MRYQPKHTDIEAMPMWDVDRDGSNYISYWIVYPAGGPYTYEHMRKMRDDEFQKLYRAAEIPETVISGGPDMRGI